MKDFSKALGVIGIWVSIAGMVYITKSINGVSFIAFFGMMATMFVCTGD